MKWEEVKINDIINGLRVKKIQEALYLKIIDFEYPNGERSFIIIWKRQFNEEAILDAIDLLKLDQTKKWVKQDNLIGER